ncbi:MAG: hypothetical protein J6V07_04595, partial [Clostridia bacterium]|nr:hypothetical protein [Clostridia bacterium]
PPAPTPAPPPVAPPPPPSPIGNMMDAFTAEDTMDIMLSPCEDRPSPAAEEAAPAPEEPLVFSRRHDLEDEEDDDLTVERPAPAPRATEETKKGREGSSMPPRGENKFFGLFMLLAALVLAVILLVGIFTGEAEDAENSPEGTYVSLPLAAEDPDAL